MADPATMALLASLMPSLTGGPQLGAPAPVFNPGFNSFEPTGLLGNQAEQANQLIQQGPPVDALSIESLIGRPQEQGQELAPQVTANDAVGPPVERAGSPGGFGEGFGNFFGNLDQNLQSPSKVIGMGLLNRIDPRLGAGGLLASGLFGKNKVF